MSTASPHNEDAGVEGRPAAPITDVTGDASRASFRDAGVPPEQRITALIALLTLDEKLALLGGRLGVARLGIPSIENVEGIHGLVVTGFLGGGSIESATTTFPQPYGMAHSWNPDLLEQAGTVIATEARYIAHSARYGYGKLLVMAPNADLARDPRWGRTEESYGEDAYLSGVLTIALVRGLQGDDPTYWRTAALLKHFLANSNEDGRLASSSDFDERLLHEYYAKPFHMGIMDGGARSYMAAYNAYNGTPCTVHPMLQQLTIEHWGLDGIICTDFRGMSNLVTKHRTHPDLPHAAADAIHAGISEFLDDYGDAVREALALGLLAEADIDAAIRRNVRILLRLGLLDTPEDVPYTRVDEAAVPWRSAQHRTIARRISREGIVLLKNEGRLLPLDKAAQQTIAVVGPLAGCVLTDLYNPRPPYLVSPVEGLANALVGHPGRLLHSPIEPIDTETMWIGMLHEAEPPLPPLYVPERDIPAAVALARAADIAVVCVGNNPMCGGWSMGHATPGLPSEGMEALDRQSLSLEQEALIQAVYAANPRMIVVLIASFPYAINWTQQHGPAIVYMAHASQETGNALADVLFGEHNPAGRLVQTWPRSLEQLPPMLDYDIRHGRTYMYSRDEPLYPFGYGLSYTSFAYGNLCLSSDVLGPNDAITISVDLANTGERAGDEVAQLYIRHLASAVERPLQELKAFRRVHLERGETRTITLPLAAHQLAYWDSAAQRFVVEPGTIQLRIGASSADIRLETTVDVMGKDQAPTRDWR